MFTILIVLILVAGLIAACIGKMAQLGDEPEEREIRERREEDLLDQLDWEWPSWA